MNITINPTQHDIDLADAVDISRTASKRLAKIVSEALDTNDRLTQAASIASLLLQFANDLENDLVRSYTQRQTELKAECTPVIDITTIKPPKRTVDLRCEVPEKLKVPTDIIKLIVGDNFELQKTQKNLSELKPWGFIKVLSKEKGKVYFRFLGSNDPRQMTQKGFSGQVYDFVQVDKCYATHSFFIGRFGSWDAALECQDEFDTERAAKKLAKLFMKREA